jgi:hypothetical protein
MSCFSFFQCIALSHAQYIYVFIYMCIYIYLYPLCIWTHWQETKCVCEYMFSRPALLLVIFFFLFAHNIQSVKYQIVLYIHIYIYVRRKGEVFWRTSKRMFDNRLFLFFSILAFCQLIETYVLNVIVFRTIIRRDDESVCACASDLFLFYPSFLF